MLTLKIDAHICIPCENFDIHLHFKGEIDVDFAPGDEAEDPTSEPDDSYDDPGEDNAEWPDDDNGVPNWPPLNNN